MSSVVATTVGEDEEGIADCCCVVSMMVGVVVTVSAACEAVVVWFVGFVCGGTTGGVSIVGAGALCSGIIVTAGVDEVVPSAESSTLEADIRGLGKANGYTYS